MQTIFATLVAMNEAFSPGFWLFIEAVYELQGRQCSVWPGRPHHFPTVRRLASGGGWFMRVCTSRLATWSSLTTPWVVLQHVACKVACCTLSSRRWCVMAMRRSTAPSGSARQHLHCRCGVPAASTLLSLGAQRTRSQS